MDEFINAVRELTEAAKDKVTYDTTTAIVVDPDGTWRAMIGGHRHVEIGEYRDFSTSFDCGHKTPLEAVKALTEIVRAAPRC